LASVEFTLEADPVTIRNRWLWRSDIRPSCCVRFSWLGAAQSNAAFLSHIQSTTAGHDNRPQPDSKL